MPDLVPTSPVSGGDLSEVTVADLCPTCEGTGILPNGLSCPACDGSGRAPTPRRRVCQNCIGHREIVVERWDENFRRLDDEQLTCPTCKGSGLQPLPYRHVVPASLIGGLALGGYGFVFGLTVPFLGTMMYVGAASLFAFGLVVAGVRAVRKPRSE